MRSKARRLALVLSVCIGWAAGAIADEPADFRTWTDASGKFKLEAAFEKFADGAVHLKRQDDGKVISLPVGRLSKEDQAFVRTLLADRAKAAAAAKADEQDRNRPKESAASEKPAAEMSWQGTWNNRKYGTDGPLICKATMKDDKNWDASFEGKGLGKPFSYQVKISTMMKNGRTLLQGTSTVSGDRYQWSGYVDGDVLYGKYRSASGNNGEFRLKKSDKQSATTRR